MAYIHLECTACGNFGMLETYDGGHWSDAYETPRKKGTVKQIIHQDQRAIHPEGRQSTYAKEGAVCPCGQG